MPPEDRRTALIRPFVGEVELPSVALSQTIDGRPQPALTAPWIRIRSELQPLWHGRFVPREVVIAQPRLRIARRKERLVEPSRGCWPTRCPGPPSPSGRHAAQQGVVELVDGPSDAVVLRDVTLNVEPTDSAPCTSRGTPWAAPSSGSASPASSTRRPAASSSAAAT